MATDNTASDKASIPRPELQKRTVDEDINHSRKKVKALELFQGLSRPPIKHREDTNSISYDGEPALTPFRSGKPAKLPQHQIRNEFPLMLDPNLADLRLQDFYVWKLFVAAKGDFATLARIHKESFVKDGIRKNRVPVASGCSTVLFAFML